MIRLPASIRVRQRAPGEEDLVVLEAPSVALIADELIVDPERWGRGYVCCGEGWFVLTASNGTFRYRLVEYLPMSNAWSATRYAAPEGWPW